MWLAAHYRVTAILGCTESSKEKLAFATVSVEDSLMSFEMRATISSESVGVVLYGGGFISSGGEMEPKKLGAKSIFTRPLKQ